MSNVQLKIVVNGIKWADGSTSTNGYIVSQPGTRAYIVSDGTKAEHAFMVNALNVNDLEPGQCFITAKPYGGVDRPCEKILQYRVSIYEANGTVKDYRWSEIPASKLGQADLNLS